MSGVPSVPFAQPDIGEEEIDAVVQTMRTGWLTTGGRTRDFENEFADFLGSDRFAVAVNSATAGLHLALEAMGVGPGAEVIVPTWTFTASAEVVRYLGADPVFVDVEESTLNLDVEAVAAAITERTRVIMPVHFAGLAADLRGVRLLAADHGLRIVEDAAHAFPCRLDGALVGSDSEAAVFSFYATKTITTGEGGMVVGSEEALAQRMRTMRLHGISRDVFDRYRSSAPSWHYEVVAPGFKYNMTDIAASIGRVQLARAQRMRDRRADIADRYTREFSELPLELPRQAPVGDEHAWHLYIVRVRGGAADRAALIERLAARGVGCSVHFIPLHLQPYWRERYDLDPNAFPVASREYDRVISLPIYSSMSEAQVEFVVDAVRSELT